MTSTPPDQPTGQTWQPPAPDQAWRPPVIAAPAEEPQPTFGYRPRPDGPAAGQPVGGPQYPGYGGPPPGSGPYQGGPGYYPPMAGVGSQGQPGGRDGFSIAAFVLGLIAIVPLAVIFGIVGLVRTKRRQRRGRWMAVTGILLAGCWVVGLVVLVATVAGQEPQRAADGAVTKAGQALSTDIRVDDCLEAPAAGVSFHRVRDLPCAEPHNAQVFAKVKLPGSSYPDTSTLTQLAMTACEPLGRTYMTSSTARLRLLVLLPQRLGWNSGNHDALCVAVDPAGDRTGDIRQDR